MVNYRTAWHSGRKIDKNCAYIPNGSYSDVNYVCIIIFIILSDMWVLQYLLSVSQLTTVFFTSGHCCHALH